MITFMTRASFLDSAADLETDLLVQVLEDGTGLFMGMMYGTYEEEAHDPGQPMAKAWYGFEAALGAYLCSINLELVTRGVSVSHHLSIAETVREVRRSDPDFVFVAPPWQEDIDVLRSHRSNLMRRWPDQYEWKRTPPNMPYVWPFVDENGSYDLMVSKSDKALLASGERELPIDIRKRIKNL